MIDFKNADDVIAIAVDVDSELRFAFYTKNTLEQMNITKLSELPFLFTANSSSRFGSNLTFVSCR